MIAEAIVKINSNAKFSVSGDDIDTCEIIWLDGTTPISKSDIQAQLPAVEFDMAMKDLRAKRDRLIAETDYVALSDLQGTLLTTEMTNYRQALRDITNGLDTVEKCNNVTWPTKP